jgi:hypothetical protein
MSRPSFGGVGALRGGDHEHQYGRHHHRQEAHVLAPRAPAWVKVWFWGKIKNILNFIIPRARERVNKTTSHL